MRLLSTVLLICVLCSCRQDMHDQPRYTPLQASTFFADGRSARPIPSKSISRDDLDPTSVEQTGNQNGGFATTIPYPVDLALLERGRQRYDIYCAPCHGYTGYGDGMIERRGFLGPANLHNDRVRRLPPGYVFQVISNGFGAMPEYGDQVAPQDRWAIVAYLRALELSQQTPTSEVPPERRQDIL